MAMESLQEILSKKQFSPPNEAKLIKDYIKRRYESSCTVTVRKDGLTITVANSALAGSLQLEKPRIIKACSIKGKLFIRVGRQ